MKWVFGFYRIKKKHEGIASKGVSQKENTMDTLLSPEKLKKSRNINSLSVEDVASYLSKRVKQVSPKTIYGWENGTSKPNSDMLIAMCTCYGISDVKDLTDEKNIDKLINDIHFLTQLEWEIVQKIRLHPELKSLICRLLEIHQGNGGAEQA